MPMGEELSQFVDTLRQLAEVQDPSATLEQLEGVKIEDLAEGIERISTEEALIILNHLDPERAGYVLVELPTSTAREIISNLPDFTVAYYLDVLPMDDAIDFREELGPERFDDLLEIIPKEDADEIRRLLAYPEDSAGRLLTEKFFEVAPETTMNELLDDIRKASDEKYETVNDVYVLSPDRHLLGVFSLRKAIRAEPNTTASMLMREDVVTCLAYDDAEAAARNMSKYGLYALPVLDHRGRMVGIFTGDDAQEILTQAESEDLLMLGGVSGEAESYLSLTVVRLAAKRLPWLLALFIAEFLTSSVMNHYSKETQLAKYLMFLPLILGAGGNSGSQATTMVTRSLAIGEVSFRDFFLVINKEFFTALLVGGCLGVAGMIRALVWGLDPNLMYAIGCSLPAIVIWATSVGGTLPLVAKRLGIDPAVMSAPFISTFVDATGLVIYFEIVKVFFGGRLPLI